MKKMFKFPTLLIGILLIGLSLFLYNNHKKEDDKPVVDNSPKVLLETKYKDKTNEEIYKALVDSSERVDLESIKGSDDTIVINSFKLIASHYSIAYVDKDENTNNGYTFCEVLGLARYTKETLGFIPLCLANVEYKQANTIYEEEKEPSVIRVSNKEAVDKLNSYGINMDINNIKDDCAAFKIKNDECNDENNYLLSIISKELTDNSFAMDVEYIKREGNGKYTVRLNGYHQGSGNTITHDEKEDHYEYTVSVKDGHIVFE